MTEEQLEGSSRDVFIDDLSKPLPESPPPKGNLPKLESHHDITMTRAEASQSRKTGLRGRLCELWHVNMFNADIADWVRDTHRNRVRMSVKKAIAMYRSNTVLYLLNKEEQDKEFAKPRRRSVFEDNHPHVASLLAMRPGNNSFRAMLMAEVGEMPPASAKTYPEIKDWYEFNFPRSEKIPPCKFIARVEKVETGTANYSGRNHQAIGVTMAVDEILTMYREGNSISDISKVILKRASRQAADELHILERAYYDVKANETTITEMSHYRDFETGVADILSRHLSREEQAQAGLI